MLRDDIWQEQSNSFLSILSCIPLVASAMAWRYRYTCTRTLIWFVPFILHTNKCLMKFSRFVYISNISITILGYSVEVIKWIIWILSVCVPTSLPALSNYVMWMEHLHMKQTNTGCQRICVYSELLWDYRFDLCPWNQLFCVLCRCTLLFCCCVIWTKQQERKCATIECNKIKCVKTENVLVFKSLKCV